MRGHNLCFGQMVVMRGHNLYFGWRQEKLSLNYAHPDGSDEGSQHTFILRIWKIIPELSMSLSLVCQQKKIEICLSLCSLLDRIFRFQRSVIDTGKL